jgi:HK97 family phage major capsid protein
MKKKFLAMLAKKEARKAELGTKAGAATDVVELRGINTELEALNGEIAELRSVIAEIPDEPATPIVPESRGAAPIPQGTLSILGTYGVSPTAQVTGEARGIDGVFEMPASTEAEKATMRSALFGSAEYRTGYFKALAGNTQGLTEVETRALTTAANSGGAAVPTTTYDMIIKRMTQTSVLFGLIKKTFIPGNVSLPVANAQTAAQWTDTAPGTDADDVLSQVTLGAYALSKFAKVKGQLILMAIDALESYVVSAISDQLAIATENVLLNGTGTNQPTGILSGVTWDATNSATWLKTGVLGYDDLVAAKALLGLYRSHAVWVMNANMEAAVYKIKTTTNQPLFTQNPINGLIADPLGFPIVVDYYMPDDTVLLFDPDYYYMNINQNPTITADDSAGFLSTSRVYRGTMFLDGKPALSAAFVKLSKALV